MVNLLVVALLLIQLGGDRPFVFICRRQDGGYIHMAITNGIARVDVGNGNGRDVAHFAGSTSQHSFTQTMNSDDIDFKASLKEHVHLRVDVDCASYRRDCPAVENLCQFAYGPKITLKMPYTGYEKIYKGGFFALITPKNQKLVKVTQELPWNKKMTLVEVCEPPHGYKEVKECHFKKLKKRSSNIDNGAATADFNKGRPARLANGLFLL